MQKTVLLIASYFLTIVAFAQQRNFVYIETDNGQPFYVKIGDKVRSSSPGGYIILSELSENNYDLRIGFPKNAFPEQRFNILLNKKDQGFQLKNFGEKGWGLFNLQTLAIIMNSNIQNTGSEQIKKTDGFSVMLSKVVNDPEILINNPKPVPEKEVVKEVAKEEGKEEAKVAIKEEVKQDTVAVVSNTIDIHKLYERRFEKMYEAGYIDRIDTIHISYAINEEPAKADTATIIVIDSTSVKKEKPVIKITNSDCKLFATDQDVDKLRVKMLNETTADDKLVVAKKYFKTKCFTVKQIRSLTELFIEDEDKYRLFDTAYPFVSDTENFSTLEENLKEEYYRNRFKAMIRK